MNESDIVDFFVLFILAIIIYTYYESQTSELKYFVSPYDSNRYLIRNRDDKDQSLRLLSSVRKKLETLISQLKSTYTDDERIVRLSKKFDPNNISETAANSQYTSYSVNKGEKLVLCLRSKSNPNQFIDENTLMFVALHELAHIMTVSIGHKDEFWNNFRFLLREASGNGMYQCVDYSKMPMPYCGIKITSSPMKCS